MAKLSVSLGPALGTWSPHEQLSEMFDWLSDGTQRLYVFSLALYSYMNDLVSFGSDGLAQQCSRSTWVAPVFPGNFNIPGGGECPRVGLTSRRGEM